MSLTLTPRTNDRGHRLPDTWEIRNASSDVARLVSVEVAGAHTYDDVSGQIRSIPIQIGDDGAESGVTLRFDDDELQRALPSNDSWSSVLVPPGTTMRATVISNRELRITYNVSERTEPNQIVVKGDA